MIEKIHQFVYYNCQMCGKKHQLQAQWLKTVEQALKKLHKQNMEKEVKELISLVALASFKLLHPDGKFDSARLQFREKE